MTGSAFPLSPPESLPKDAGHPDNSATTDSPASQTLLYISDMHCGGCISKIEARLGQMPAVISARVNLSLKQVRINAAPHLPAQAMVDALAEIGFSARPLDSHVLPDDKAEMRATLLRIAVAGFGMMNVMLLSVSVWSGADAATRQLLHLISALIALPVLIYAARPFFASAFKVLRHWQMNMDVPISLAILLASLNSLYDALTGGAHAYFDAALALTFFLLSGRYLEQLARSKARSAAALLAGRQSRFATIRRRRQLCRMAVDDIREGDRLVSAAGEAIACDGQVIKGESETDRSFLTGESLPVAVRAGTRVYASEINLTGQLEIEVSARNTDSLLTRIISLVDIAETSRNRYTALADRAARIYAPAVHVLAAIGFLFWYGTSNDFHLSLSVAIALLIITCPCALGLAVPAVVTITSGRLFKGGILLKNATALERLAEIDVIVFDKTGTLTSGQFTAADLDRFSVQDLGVMRALAAASHHPLSTALYDALAARKLPEPALENITELPAKGVRAVYNGHIVMLGHPDWVAKDSVQSQFSGQARLGFKSPDTGVHFLCFDEHIHKDVPEMLACLDKMGYRRLLLTGDNTQSAQIIADQLGFDEVIAGVTPEDKMAHIQRLQASGRKVLMAGDGLNDTAALATAHAAIAPADALDAARSSADAILLGHNIQGLPFLLASARSAKKRILENFALALIYNLIAVPLAFAGLATPLAAAIAMSASSVSVSLNAFRAPGQNKGADR